MASALSYEPHYDYFDVTDPGTAKLVATGGQRVATLITYLNTPDAGGATIFPDLGLEVAPIKGNAVFFSYDRPVADTLTLHGGTPVAKVRSGLQRAGCANGLSLVETAMLTQ